MSESREWEAGRSGAAWDAAGLRAPLPELSEPRRALLRQVAQRLAPLLPTVHDVDIEAFSPACRFDAGWSYADDR